MIIPVPIPVPVPRIVDDVVAVPLDQKAVVFRGKGKRALVITVVVVVKYVNGAVVRITPVPVVSIIAVPVPRGGKVVDVPLDHGAVGFWG